MGSEAARWLRTLPIRWAAVGLLVAVLYVVAAALPLPGRVPPGGGFVALAIRAAELAVIPLFAIGYFWGLSERIALQNALADGKEQLERAIRRMPRRHAWRGAVFGAVLAILFRTTGRLGAFRPWDGVENLLANTANVLALALPGAVLGVAIGFVARRNLVRRMAPPAEGST